MTSEVFICGHGVRLHDYSNPGNEAKHGHYQIESRHGKIIYNSFMHHKKIIRVILVDDHLHIHKAVSTLLNSTSDIDLVGQVMNGADAINLCKSLNPDVVLMDVLMPGTNGVEATKTLKEKFPELKILVLTSLQDHEILFEMLRNGASGYITKTTLMDDLAETIRATHNGKMVFSPEAIDQLVFNKKGQAETNLNLTNREMDVLLAMAEGLNMPEIALKLKISSSTVKFHIENICIKMGVRTRSQALIIATKLKLI